MTINLETLRKTAEAATPGPREADVYQYSSGFRVTRKNPDHPAGKDTLASPDRTEDAKFIATFDPPTVLALLSRLEQAEQAVQRVRELHSSIPVVVNFDDAPTDYCDFCGDEQYPCSTIRALDGDGRG